MKVESRKVLAQIPRIETIVTLNE